MATDPTMIDQWYSDYMQSQPATQTAAAPTVGTEQWTPGEDASVANQVAKITAAGSPLITQAETAAKQQANAQGMLNSTMALQAGRTGVYNTVLPMAQQDASTAAQVGQFNTAAKNNAMLATAGFQADANRFNASAANDATAQQRAAGVSGYQQQQQFAAQTSQQIRDIEAQAAAQGRQLSAQEQAQIRELEAAATRQQAGFTQEQTMQAQQFEQQRQILTQQTDEQLRLLDAQNGTKLSDAYRTTSQATYDAYIADVQRIQESDMDPDVKAAQIQNMQGLYQTRQEYINTIYSFSPGWSSDWSQFAVEFDQPAEATGG